jgi:hypothetical protein
VKFNHCKVVTPLPPVMDRNVLPDKNCPAEIFAGEVKTVTNSRQYQGYPIVVIIYE